ncbi:Inactive phospholipase C-like protein 1 [Chionoecetes opilio]|uniref:Phosphoinositide phospholipase C n=1 Tax=Chionoecetes opilio TaxID=41210 RepID=A0A8J4XM01_CHIOP|nr:Inactive phospholipase C-like protein 1 [Chionoecetes opilio]
MCSLSESTSAKLAHTCPEELVNHNKKFLTRVFPNSSRVDSSNYNPQDFWNAGCQMVALNFQTPGQFMDVYEGRFRANGGCGYLLKPAVMREHISVFSAHSRETIPGVAPQLLKIKVISGQCLPKPRGSTATKASFIDPYVVIQVFGIPADCTEALHSYVSHSTNLHILRGPPLICFSLHQPPHPQRPSTHMFLIPPTSTPPEALHSYVPHSTNLHTPRGPPLICSSFHQPPHPQRPSTHMFLIPPTSTPPEALHSYVLIPPTSTPQRPSTHMFLIPPTSTPPEALHSYVPHSTNLHTPRGPPLICSSFHQPPHPQRPSTHMFLIPPTSTPQRPSTYNVTLHRPTPQRLPLCSPSQLHTPRGPPLICSSFHQPPHPQRPSTHMFLIPPTSTPSEALHSYVSHSTNLHTPRGPPLICSSFHQPPHPQRPSTHMFLIPPTSTPPEALHSYVPHSTNLHTPRGPPLICSSFHQPPHPQRPSTHMFLIPPTSTPSEAKTRTVSNDSSCPIFDESFEFQINLPELAIVRFVVLDDDFIGDDFVGQCTIPLDCIQTGYRHVRLLSSMGEPIESATLFVHVSISNKKGGGKPQRVKGKKTDKLRADIKPIGLKAADDMFKEASVSLVEGECVQDKVEDAWTELQDECGLEHTANMKQCLRVTISRYMATPDTARLSIQEENGVPFLRSSRPGPQPSHLHRLEIALQKVLLEIHHFLGHEEELHSTLDSRLKPCLAMYDSLESLLSSNGIKGKKANRAMENYAWNVRIIRGQLDRLTTLTKKCKIAMEQVESTKTTLDTLNQRERSPQVRERPRLTLANRHNTTDNLTTYGSLGRSPTTPGADCKPKSILKKSNSNLEASSIGYVNEETPASPCSSGTMVADEEGNEAGQLLKPPLLHSFSYTPTFTYEQDTAL